MEENIFHIINRGVEKRKIFLNTQDYLRFVNNMEDFNAADNILESYNRRRGNLLKSDMRYPTELKKPIVNVLAWCLMPNHIHILISEKVAGGASMFAKKLTGGYTKYFNLKYKRVGVLFQGRSKIINIKQDGHLTCLPYYIFANPIKLIEPSWQEKGIKNTKQVVQFLENYQWSSLKDTIKQNNLSPIINKTLLFELLEVNEGLIREDFLKWINAVGHRMSDKL